MILVDTSIWIDHINKGGDEALFHLMEGGSVLTHAFVLGEVAMGSLKTRRSTLALISDMPRMTTASDLEVMTFVESAHLHGTGLTYIDTHLLAAVIATPAARSVRLWTRDEKLRRQAERFKVAYAP